MNQQNPNTTFPVPVPPKRWNPEDARYLTTATLKLAPAVERQLPDLGLSVDNLLTVLRNSPWRAYTYYYLFTFEDVPDPDDPGLKAVTADGLADVSILMEWARPRVVGVTRGPLPHTPAGMPPFPPTIGPQMPRLTRHAFRRLSERHLTPADVRFVMRHGRWVLVEGHLHCAIAGRRRRTVSARQWKRLQGALVIVCPFSNEVITTWWDPPCPKETRRWPYRPARQPRYKRPSGRDWRKYH